MDRSHRLSMEQLACWSMALVCGGGGAYGYMQKRSIPSLVAGLGFGALYGLSGYWIRSGRALDGVDLSICLVLVTSAFLLIAMGPRAYQTKAALPTTLAAASGLILARMGYVSYNLRH